MCIKILASIKALYIAVIIFGIVQVWRNYNHLASKIKSAYKFDQPFPTSAGNATLGFQKMVYINLAHRYDYDDAMTLQSLVSNITLIRQPGVNSADLRDAGLPPASEGEIFYVGEESKKKNRHVIVPMRIYGDK